MTLPCRWAEGGLTGFRGRVRFRRRFGYPGRIDAHERVWLTFAGADSWASIRLNETDLGRHPGGPLEFEVTALLQSRNELVVEVEGTEEGGLWGEVALEVRCSAFLRGVRVWIAPEEAGGTLHAAGQVVGTADRPLDLYVLLDRATLAYTAVMPAPTGTPFHLSGALVKQGEQASGLVKVDLVNGAMVWYTNEEALTLGTAGDD
jgi:hypothetical protein